MATRDFLVEIGTEELPPKALLSLSRAFAAGVSSALLQAQLGFGAVKLFATPRRLALLVSSLDEQQSDRKVERFGPAVSAAFGKDGSPSTAAIGFAKSCGVEVKDLSRPERWR